MTLIWHVELARQRQHLPIQAAQVVAAHLAGWCGGAVHQAGRTVGLPSTMYTSLLDLM